MKIKINKNIFMPAYLPHLQEQTDKKINIFYGGVGSGKSYFIVQKLIYFCLTNNKEGILIIRKVQATLKSTVITTIQQVLKDMGLNKIVVEQKDKEDRRFLFPNGSFFLLKGYDDPEKLKGVPNITKIWMEEATDFLQEDYSALTARIRGRNAKNIKIYMSFNPIWIGHWINQEFFINGEDAKEEDIKIVKTTYKDNKFYGDTSLLLKLQQTNPRRWKIDGLGEWGVYGELIYENWQTITREELNKVNIVEYCWGLDFGFTHSTALIKLGKDIKGNLYVMEEIYYPKLIPRELINKIKNKFPNEWKFMEIIADSSRPEAIEEFKQEGFYIKGTKKGAGSVLEGIEKIQGKEVYVVEDCKGTIFEKDSYSWQKDNKTGLYIPKPVKTQDDAMDAIRYAAEKLLQNNFITF